MKKGNSHLGNLRKVLALALAFALTFTFVNPLTAEAKNKRIELESTDQYDNLAEVDAIAKTVKKGSYTFVMKEKDGDCQGFAKFVAPKTKTYTFTVSKANSLGYVAGKMKDKRVDNYLNYVDFKTKGPKKSELDVCDSNFDNYLKKRTGKIKLKKGQVLYLEFSFSGSVKKAKVNVTIK